MKKIFIQLSLLLTALLFVGCNNDFDTSNYASDSSFLNNKIALDAVSANISGTNFKYSTSVHTTETINEITQDVITVTFVNGKVDNTTANLANITFYPLLNSADDTTPFIRGTAVSFTTKEVTYSGTTTTIEFKIADASFADNTAYEIVINPELTAYDSAIKLNQDGDILAGEANDDQYIAYVVLGTPTITAGRIRNNPSDARGSITLGTFIDTDGNITYNVDDGAAAAFTTNTISKATLDAAFYVEQYSYTDHTWTEVSAPTTTFNTTTDEYVIKIATLEGETFRWYFDQQLIVQDTDIDGTEGYYKLNPVYTNANFTTSYNDSYENATSTYYSATTVAETHSNVPGDKYVDLTFTLPVVGSDINAATLTATSVKFVITDGGTTLNLEYTGDVEEIADNVFRFRFDTALDITGVTGTVYQTVTEDNASVATGDDTHIENKTF